MPDSADRVVIVGAGPVGMVAAACLGAEGIPVTVVERTNDLPKDLRASTFHPPTLDMLDRFGVSEKLVARGLVCPTWQFRDRNEGVVAEYDLGLLKNETAHPYRLQCEQWKLGEELGPVLEAMDCVELRYGLTASGLSEDEDGVSLTVTDESGSEDVLRCRYLIGADGAHSAIRKALDIDFEGLTIPEIFLTMSTEFAFHEAMPGLSNIAYISDPQEWFVLLRTPSLWRVLIPMDPTLSDEEIRSPARIERHLQGICAQPEPYEIVHATAYRVHQRVAKTYVSGRTFLVGDAAHLNNPLGGMGMNGGIHDSVNLVEKLLPVWHGKADLRTMGRYDRQRRKAAIETVQEQSLRNRRIMAEADPEMRRKYHDELRASVADPERHKAFLLKSSMIQSLRDLDEVA